MERLETNRLILRALTLEDLEAFYAYCKKETIGPNAGWRPHTNIEESSRILNMMISENEVWGIELKENHQLIGTLGLHVRNFDNALANRKEIGYVLDDTYWGYGYMTEAVKEVLRHAFVDQELSEVVVGHAVSNDRSRRVIEKVGFIYTHDEERDHYDGTKILIKMYILNQETWRAKK